MEFEFDPSILDPNERLIYSLMNQELAWSKDIGRFMTTLNGLKVEIHGSHVQKRSDGGGIMSLITGVRPQIIEDYWEYELLVAAAPGQHVFGGIEIATGDFGPAIDSLLEELYWFAHNQHHNQSLENILKRVEEKEIF